MRYVSLRKKAIQMLAMILLLTVFWPVQGVNSYQMTFTTTLRDGAVTAARRPLLMLSVSDTIAEITDITIYLDDQKVPRMFDKVSSTAWYNPVRPLVPGLHTVKYATYMRDGKIAEIIVSFKVIEEVGSPEIMKEEVARIISAVNAFRAELGLPLVQYECNLTISAQNHVNYLHLNDELSHFETLGKPGFTGENLYERTLRAGFTGIQVSEVGTGEAWPVESSVRRLANAPYHRSAFLDPNNQLVGAGVSWQTDGQGRNLVFLNFGMNRPALDDRVMLYPYPGQTDAQVAWEDDETPSPLRFYGETKGTIVGYPVSVTIHDDRTTELRTVFAALMDDRGSSVPIYKIDSSLETDQVWGQDRKKHLFLIPMKPLKPGARYDVHVQGFRILKNGAQIPLNLKWSFYTSPVLVVKYGRILCKNGIDYVQVFAENGDLPDLTYFLLKGENLRRIVQDGSPVWREGDRLENGVYRLEVLSKMFGQTKVYEVEITGPFQKRQLFLHEMNAEPMVKLVEE